MTQEDKLKVQLDDIRELAKDEQLFRDSAHWHYCNSAGPAKEGFYALFTRAADDCKKRIEDILKDR